MHVLCLIGNTSSTSALTRTALARWGIPRPSSFAAASAGRRRTSRFTRSIRTSPWLDRRVTPTGSRLGARRQHIGAYRYLEQPSRVPALPGGGSSRACSTSREGPILTRVRAVPARSLCSMVGCPRQLHESASISGCRRSRRGRRDAAGRGACQRSAVRCRSGRPRRFARTAAYQRTWPSSAAMSARSSWARSLFLSRTSF